MSLSKWIHDLIIRHTELGRQHEQLGSALHDLKKEAEQVQNTVDEAIDNLQKFATKVRTKRINDLQSQTRTTKARSCVRSSPGIKRV